MKRIIVLILCSLFIACWYTKIDAKESDSKRGTFNSLVVQQGADQNIEWTLDNEGTLTITGTGNMPNYSGFVIPGFPQAPWASYNKKIYSVIIEDTITSIGTSSFFGCSNLNSIAIPNSITEIGGSAFHFCSSLSSITIPDSVTSIGDYAFHDCSSLSSITIPDSVTSIGDCAFSGCSSLTSIDVNQNNSRYTSIDGVLYKKINDTLLMLQKYPSGSNRLSYVIQESAISIVDYAFEDSSNLVSITIPDSVTSIGYRAFSNCSSLTSITIPDSVTSIGDSAFSNCSSLTSITIPDSVASIRDHAFSGCSSLTSINIPNSVIWIGAGAFVNCASLSSITIPDSVTSIGDSAFYGCSCLTSLTMSNSLTSIRDHAFSGCSSLSSITIPNSVTSIGSNVFKNCSNLTSLTMPISANIQQYSFTGLTNLESITLTAGTGVGVDYTSETYQYTPWYLSRNELISLNLSNGITSIGSYTFKGQLISSINIPNSVISIGNCAFHSCSNLTSITNPNSITSIGNNAFRYCSGLTSITIPDSVTSIGDWAFCDCPNLVSLTIPISATIQSSSFSGVTNLESVTLTPGTGVGANSNPRFLSINSLTSLVLEDGITSIGSSAFYGCSSLTSITIPDSVTSIGDYAFYDCSGLTSLTMSNSLTSIGDSAFTNCESLTSINIPNSVISIGLGAFGNCTGLSSITIPDSVTSIGSSAFYGCSCLTSLTMPISTTFWGNSFTGTNLESITLTAGIGTGVYYGDNSYKITPWYLRRNELTSLTLSNGITSIGNYTFKEQLISSINIPNSVTSIGRCAFEYCSSLTSIEIPNSVTYIGPYAFSNCSSLTSITIPNSVTSIGNRAFCDCPNLVSLTMPISITITNNSNFYGVTNLESITLTAGNGTGINYTKTTYQYTPWYLSRSNLTNVVLEDGITYIGDYTFKDQSNITQIIIPSTVSSIGEHVFDNCNANLVLASYENEYLQQYCLNNGYTYLELTKISDKTMNGTLKPNGTVSLNLKVNIDDAIDLEEGAYALINGDKVLLADKIDSNNGKVVVSTQGVAPKNLGDVITIRYFDGEDNPISKEISYSVTDYMNSLLETEISENERTLYKSILNYSAYAQEYFEYNTENLVNSNLTESDKDLSNITHENVSDYAVVVQGTTEGISALGESLSLNEEVSYKVYFTLDGTHNIDEYIFKDGDDLLTPYLYQDNCYYVFITKLAAPDLDKSHIITVALDDATPLPEFGEIEQGANVGDLTIKASVLTYAELILKKDNTTEQAIKLENLMKAMYKYSLAAKSVIGG